MACSCSDMAVVETLAGGVHTTICGLDWPQDFLSYLQNAKLLNSLQAQWALFLGCFRFSLMYRPGYHTTKPDALCCQFSHFSISELSPILYTACIGGAISWPGEERVLAMQQKAPDPCFSPPNCLFVTDSAQLNFLQWGNSSRPLWPNPDPTISFGNASGGPPWPEIPGLSYPRPACALGQSS